MSKEKTYTSIQKLIQSGKTNDVFSLLRQQSLPKPTGKTVAIIEAEYNELRQAELKGLLTFQEIQIRKNQINDKLLTLFQNEPTEPTKPINRSLLLKILLPLGFLIGGLLFWWMTSLGDNVCPKFPEKITNKILILPFINVGNKPAQPHIVLKDRINQLTKKNSLSATAKLGNSNKNILMKDAASIATQCKANVLVWGTYSNRTDSINLVLQYRFTNKPEWNNLGQLITLKDVTSLQNGKMLKTLDDAILSLCGIIALREGKEKTAKKWLKKVAKKENVDKRLLREID